MKFILKKILINLFLIIFYIKSSIAHNFTKQQLNTNKCPSIYNNNYLRLHQDSIIHIHSDNITIYYPKKIQLNGNVLIQYNNDNITSNKLTIFSHNCNNFRNSTLYAHGNVNYYNNYFQLSGTDAKFQLYNHNVDINNGTFYLKKLNIYGTASSIIQRSQNNYTIIKNGNFTACPSNKNYWNITGSKIIYDYHNQQMNIWHTYLKIKKIPIFYSPYLLLDFNKKNNFKSFIPTIQYNSKHGIILTTPFPLNFSKYHSSNIAPYYTSKSNIGLYAKTYYSTSPKTGGSINLNIIKNKNKYQHPNYFYKLQWKHHSVIHKTWYINIHHSNTNQTKYYQNNDQINDTAYQKHINHFFLCYHDDNYYKASLTYINNKNKYYQTISDNHIYSLSPKLELHLYYNIIKPISLKIHIYNQFSKFVPTNYIYPKTIRIHTEPIINFYFIYKHWLRLHCESKFSMTHYRQQNIEYYNSHLLHNNYQLQKITNRIIPQIKITGNTCLYKNIHTTSKYKYYLEPKLQYLYVPNIFQENIGIYDSKTIYINHYNLFHGTLCSGLDRIFSINQIIGQINTKCINTNNKELFYISVGQIFNLSKKNLHTTNQPIQHHQNYIINNISKLISGEIRFNITQHYNIRTEIQYNTIFKQISYYNANLEYIGKNNQIFQTNYRYINSQYLKNNLIKHENLSNYYQTISQLGIISYYPLTTHWKISYAYYQNINTHTPIDQCIGLQHITPCWIFQITFERRIVGCNNINHVNMYDNKIKINLNIYNEKSNLYLDLHKILYFNLIPYQKILKHI